MPAVELKVAPEALEAWKEMNQNGKYQYLILSLINDYTYITLDYAHERNLAAADTNADGFDSLKTKIQATPKECRFVLFRCDWDQIEQGGMNAGKRTKIVFVSVTPNDANVKAKMMYASCRGPLKKTLGGVPCDLQSGPHSISLEEIMEKAKQYTK